MIARLLFPAALSVSFATEPWQAACIAFDAPSKTIHASEVFEADCAGGADGCRQDVTAKWAAFLKKEKIAQAAGNPAPVCEVYAKGSTPDESPRSRVRKWRDEAMAQSQQGGKYTRVTMTTFGET